MVVDDSHPPLRGRGRQVSRLFDEDDAHERQCNPAILGCVQNLRDKLLKAGLVTEKQASEAARDTRQPKKHREREAKETAEEKQRREAFAAREAELAEERRKEAAKVAEARMQSERARRLRQIVESNRIDDPGASMFHYVRRSGKIGRLAVEPGVDGGLVQATDLDATTAEPGQEVQRGADLLPCPGGGCFGERAGLYPLSRPAQSNSACCPPKGRPDATA